MTLAKWVKRCQSLVLKMMGAHWNTLETPGNDLLQARRSNMDLSTLSFHNRRLQENWGGVLFKLASRY